MSRTGELRHRGTADPPKSADLNGFEFAGANETEGHRPSDPEELRSLLDGQEDLPCVVVGHAAAP